MHCLLATNAAEDGACDGTDLMYNINFFNLNQSVQNGCSRDERRMKEQRNIIIVRLRRQTDRRVVEALSKMS